MAPFGGPAASTRWLHRLGDRHLFDL